MDTLESIITDLLGEVFQNSVSLDLLADRLIWTGGHDFHRVSKEMILEAITLDILNNCCWHDIGFGCDETLCHCRCLNSQNIGIDPSKVYEEKLEMCVFLLAVGLLAKACRMQNKALSDFSFFNQILHALYFYCDFPSPSFDIEHHIERLLKHIYRPGCP